MSDILSNSKDVEPRCLTVEKVFKGTHKRHRKAQVVCICGKRYTLSLVAVGRNKGGCRDCFTKKKLRDEVFCGSADYYRSAYNRWNSMIRRCHNVGDKRFPDYGARGIAVYKPWREDFDAFARYLATLPGFSEAFKGGFQIDRIDNNKGYEPGNVRFVTPSGNCRNRRSNKTINYEGKDYSTWDFHEKFCSRTPWKTFKTYASRNSPARLIELSQSYQSKVSKAVTVAHSGGSYSLKEFRAKFCPEASMPLLRKLEKSSSCGEDLLNKIAATRLRGPRKPQATVRR